MAKAPEEYPEVLLFGKPGRARAESRPAARAEIGAGPEDARRRRAAEELLADYVQRGAAAAAEERYHDTGLLELLFEKGEAAQPVDPPAGLTWAGLTLALARAMAPPPRHLGPFGPIPVPDDDVARACRHEANALRFARDLESAEHSLREASHALTSSSPERPWYCRSLGVLYWDQNRAFEAVPLLEWAATLFEDAHNEEEVATCRLLAGLLALEMGYASRVLPALLSGWTHARPNLQPWLRLCGGLALAGELAAAGERQRGRAVLTTAVSLYPQVRDEPATLYALRLEGGARWRLGEFQEASDLLEGVRLKYVELGDEVGLGLSTLELAVVKMGLHRPEDFNSLLESTEALSKKEGGHVVTALHSFLVGVLDGDHPGRAAARAGADLRRHCGSYGIGLGRPVPFA